MAVLNYRELVAWQKAMELAADCHRIVQRFPKHETYGMSAVIQRLAGKIPSEIAHGQGRPTTQDFLWHLGHANGTRCELETQLILAHRVGYIPEEEINPLLERCLELSRVLHGLINSLERKIT